MNSLVPARTLLFLPSLPPSFAALPWLFTEGASTLVGLVRNRPVLLLLLF